MKCNKEGSLKNLVVVVVVVVVAVVLFLRIDNCGNKKFGRSLLKKKENMKNIIQISH